ncbi:CACTA en-spm transposon protein [Cucumis melo var. makuwa]|uniref:CACTA en-spm transposon protein n=1 Tax=Cucumis melo var. makuwa TaxID=1194695 RepID=A0A5A7V697_CUCMM|nr:CACTA en-spm transposon protein [Cucumis melo var. makuwa]TYK14698.1 CACTA en-spm transposon protein [Cucumis melo var. makuwa]
MFNSRLVGFKEQDIVSGNQNRKGKGEERTVEASPSVARPFHSVVVAVPRRSAAVCHLSYGSLFELNIFIVDFRWLFYSYAIMSSSYPHNFMETDSMFLEFEDDLDNIAGGSSSVGDNMVSTLGIRAPHCNKWAYSDDDPLGAEKPIFPHAVRFSQAIGLCVRKTFSVRCLKWVDVGKEYIKVVNGDLQMLTIFKEFRADCHRHFKKYSDPEKARANPPNALVGRHED